MVDNLGILNTTATLFADAQTPCPRHPGPTHAISVEAFDVEFGRSKAVRLLLDLRAQFPLADHATLSTN